MKLSLRGEYALRALLVLGLHSHDSIVPVHVISKEQNIPKRFLEQILNDLRAAGIVQSKRGPAGGYRLARLPEEISLATVVRRMEGPLAPIRCVSEMFYEPCTCPNESQCALRSLMKQVRDAIVQLLERFTVADLCERARQVRSPGGSAIDYMI